MLDLNLEVVISSGSSSSSCRLQAETAAAAAVGGLKLPEATEDDDSGTSNSSVVNAAEDDGDDSLSFLAFDFMTKREEALGGEIITRQFFPVVDSGVEGGEDCRRFGKGTMESPQWLYLSFEESRGESGMLQQQQQQQQMQPPLHQPVRKSRRGPRSRSSQYRGVTFYRRTGRWESHIWDCGKQVYLGGFDTAYAAARAYDRAAIKFRGVNADINFSVSDYEEDMKQMPNLTKEEFVHILRRQSTGVSREASKYRGATLQMCGRWYPRMGQSLGKRPLDKAVGKLEPGLYERQIIFNAGSKGSGGQNLELSLGMGPTPIPISSKVVEHKKEYFQWIDREESGPTLCREFPAAGCSSSVPKGGGTVNFALPPKRPLIWSSMYPTAVSPNYELTMAEKRVEPISSSVSTRLPCYRRPSHGSNPVIGSASALYAMPMFASNNLSNAASSGFSSPTTTPPPQYLTTVSASTLPPNKDGCHVPAAGGYNAYRG